MHSKSKGFTLIEVMIAGSIIAILASIAYSSYSSSVNKSRRSDALDALSTAAAMQERHFLQNNQYSEDETLIGGNTSKEGYYSILAEFKLGGVACTGATGSCYSLTATAQGAQASDTTCANLRLDSLGRKYAKNSGGTDTTDICW